MFKLMTSLIFLSLTNGLAQTPEVAASCSTLSPFLYKLEKDGKSSFLLGTMHLGIPLSAYPKEIYSAFENAKVTAFENDRDEMNQELGSKIEERSKFPPGQTLKDVLREPSIKKLEDIYGAKNAALLNQKRPWIVYDQIESNAEDLMAKREGVSWSRDDGIDSVLVRKARELGKQIELIDKNRDVLADLESYTTAKDLDDLLAFSDPIQHVADCAALAKSAFCAGSEQLIEQYNKSTCESAGLMTALYRRTRNWIPELTKLFTEGNVFAAVGSGHLVGPDGLIALLRQQGFVVTRQ